MDRCQMDAIRELDDAWEVVEGRCIGCGLCVSECPTSAISMVAKPGMEAPPRDFHETIHRIGAERGLP
jgi:Fe-S-cluster-containing hydrogenase component 2